LPFHDVWFNPGRGIVVPGHVRRLTGTVSLPRLWVARSSR
jgi:hypothetical protein